VGTGGVGDDAGEGGFAGAGRAVEDEGGELVGLDGAAEEAARADDVVLAHEFVQGAGPHAGGEGLFFFEDVLGVEGEEVGH